MKKNTEKEQELKLLDLPIDPVAQPMARDAEDAIAMLAGLERLMLATNDPVWSWFCALLVLTGDTTINVLDLAAEHKWRSAMVEATFATALKYAACGWLRVNSGAGTVSLIANGV